MTTTEADGASEEARALVHNAVTDEQLADSVMNLPWNHKAAKQQSTRELLTYIASLEAENERLEDQRDEHCRREVEYGDALRRIVNLEIPLGVGAECADWFKGIARQALDSEEG